VEFNVCAISRSRQNWRNVLDVKQVPLSEIIRSGMPRSSQNFFNRRITPAASVVLHGYRWTYLVRLSATTNKYLLYAVDVSNGPR